MSSIFSLPFPSFQQPTPARTRQSVNKKRKRRIRDASATAVELQKHEQIDSLGQDHQALEYTAVLTPDERIQRRVAGQPFNQVPPGYPFPHASHSRSREGRVVRDDAGPPSLSATERKDGSEQFRRSTLHLQHLGAITAILHRCLMEGDFKRAGRVLSLILRDRVGGRDVDLRSEGRWGIGPEILLRQGTEPLRQHSTRDGVLEETNSQRSAPPTRPLHTVKGFDDARKYYERLIIQFPFHISSPGAVNAVDFYKAMFGLWIFVAHEEGKGHEASAELPSNDGLEDQYSNLFPSPHFHAAKVRELQQAREIAGRMDNAMGSFPYSNDLELIQLRGMVALWVADLIDLCSKGAAEQKDTMNVDRLPMDVLVDDIDRIDLTSQEASRSDRSMQMVSEESRQIARNMFEKLKRTSPG